MEKCINWQPVTPMVIHYATIFKPLKAHAVLPILLNPAPFVKGVSMTSRLWFLKREDKPVAKYSSQPRVISLVMPHATPFNLLNGDVVQIRQLNLQIISP